MNPSSVTIGGGKGGQVNVTITIQTDSFAYAGKARVGCLGPTLLSGPSMVWSNYVWYVIIGGYIYDPKIKGRILLSQDTLDFGAVSVGRDTFITPAISVDTVGSIFRKLLPLNVRAPFASSDSITPQFDSCYLPNAGTSEFFFSPAQVGRYIDTIFLYDPIRKDSTKLILIGNGVAAGVSDNPIASELRIHPNPADRSASLSLPDGLIELVTLYDILGDPIQRVLSEGSSPISLKTSALPAGLYYVEARSREQIFRERLMVCH